MRRRDPENGTVMGQCVWCQTCKEWVPIGAGGHRLDHFLERHLTQLLAERDRR